MAEDVKPEVIKKTQELLGKYFKKPPLTEKLLKKPPFRFLHDIISVVIKETGFLDGLFTEEELNSENIKNKETKLAYLSKLIDVVKLATGINLTVRASKIVSGQEPTKTNELLQAIGKALDKKISSKEAIEQYKKNLAKGKSSKSKSSVGKEERKSSKERSQKKVSADKEKSAEQKKQVSSINNETINEIETSKNENQESQKHAEVKEVPQVEISPNKIPSSAYRKSSSAKLKKTPSVSSPEAITSQTNVEKIDKNKKLKESESKSKQIIHDDNSEAQDQILNIMDTVHSESKFPNSTENDKMNENAKPIEHKENEVRNNETPLQNGRISDPIALEVQKFQLENTELDNFSNSQTSSRQKTSLRPPSSRPISARPAAPRIRGKAELTASEEILTPMGNISVIVENADTRDDDDAEDMVVLETKGGSSDSLENSNIYKANDQLTQEHGHLVAQILETQKELVNNENVDVIPKKTNIAWDTSSKRDIVTKEIEKLRNTIQSLTRATNPLGKLLDYFQEDVEIMQKELLDWRNQYQQVNEELKVEKMKTQELIEPMKETLKEIDHNMKTQLDKIFQAKLQIMKNDQRIQTLLNGHV